MLLVGAVGDVQAVVVDIQRDVVVGKARPIVVAGDGNILVDLDVIGGQRRRGGHHGRQSVQPASCSRKLFQLHLQRPPSSSMRFADGLLVAAVVRGSLRRWKSRMMARMTQNMIADKRVDLGADLLAGHRVDGDGQCLHRAGVEVGNHEIINGVGQADEECRQDGRGQLRHDDLEESLPRCAAQIQRCVVQAGVQLAQLGAYVEDNIRDIEGDVRNQQRAGQPKMPLSPPMPKFCAMTKSSISETPVMISGLTTGT